MLLDCVYILEHHPNLFLANFWALNCVGNFTGLNLFEPELDLNLWSGPKFRNLPQLNHRSSSRFMKILKEPDRTRLWQHYLQKLNLLQSRQSALQWPRNQTKSATTLGTQ